MQSTDCDSLFSPKGLSCPSSSFFLSTTLLPSLPFRCRLSFSCLFVSSRMFHKCQPRASNSFPSGARISIIISPSSITSCLLEVWFVSILVFLVFFFSPCCSVQHFIFMTPPAKGKFDTQYPLLSIFFFQAPVPSKSLFGSRGLDEEPR